MMRSEQINELAKSLAQAQGEFPVLEKKSQGYGYRYADIAETIQAIQEPLKKNELSLVHQLEFYERCDCLISTLIHSSGQYISTRTPLIHKADGKVNAMQALGSAMTYAKRYAIACLLNLAADKEIDTGDKEIDDDGVKSAPANYVQERVKLPVLLPEQVEQIEKYFLEFPSAGKFLLTKLGVSSISQIPYDQYEHLVNVFEKKKRDIEAEGKNG